jgi:hypothetical protein
LKNLFKEFEMRSPATPSVDQLLVLLTVAEAGSFTAAAKRLGRATSAISYAIDTLEEQLGLSLFDRGTTRKPKLTQQAKQSCLKPERLPIASRHCARAFGDSSMNLNLKCHLWSTARCRAIG